MFYKNIQSCVINNGLGSDYFTLKRGVRQGDPLSPHLYLLAVETLAISIRYNADIEGVKMGIGSHETKVLQYADDTTEFLSNENSAKILFEELNVLKNFSALEVNSSKTEGMWIGSLKGNDQKPCSIKWPSEPIKALGTFFTFDQSASREKRPGKG